MNADIQRLIAERLEKGRKTYGHELLPDAGYDWVQEALEEALDLSIYITARLIEVKQGQRPAEHSSSHAQDSYEYCQ
jgi:hypothetical protein